ncbi:response regulator [Dongia rigui]|uniref:Response regulator n=1 Tax=Dongia rigui TaxID=940149 RepID=A0ABU5DVU7_9PROT|nr:response regulator [Dongia rigui]MDY0871418.1 response regulator [Dongia rigui]
MSAHAHILVVDDDKRLRDLIARYLGEQGFRVTVAIDAADARAKLKSISFDLLVLDIMMPGESGLDLTRALRLESSVPILLLTAMGEVQDRINGLETGADDYLGKPFEPKELVLRINAILKRAQPRVAPPPVAAGTVKFGAFAFELERRRLYKGGDIVHLTEGESELLTTLARRAGQPVSRDELQTRGVGEGDEFGAEAPDGNVVEVGASRLIDVQVTRLRRKIEDDPRFPRYLQTVRGIGYVLRPD